MGLRTIVVSHLRDKIRREDGARKFCFGQRLMYWVLLSVLNVNASPGSDSLILKFVYVQVRDWPCPSSKTCFRLTPRSRSIQMVTLGRFFFTFGSLATSSSFSVFTPLIVSGPRSVMSHFSASSLPLAPKPSIR